jgi:hypothetical protein
VTFLCGPGYEGREITFACPAVVPVAACMWFDERARAWSTAGCAVRNISETAVVCECSHLTDFAVRFAALDQANEDLFAQEDAQIVATTLGFTSPLLYVLGAAALLTALSVVGGAAADASAAPRFARALAADGDLAGVAAAAAARGAPWPLDRAAPRIKPGSATTEVGGESRAARRHRRTNTTRIAPAPAPNGASGVASLRSPPPPASTSLGGEGRSTRVFAPSTPAASDIIVATRAARATSATSTWSAGSALSIAAEWRLAARAHAAARAREALPRGARVAPVPRSAQARETGDNGGDDDDGLEELEDVG